MSIKPADLIIFFDIVSTWSFHVKHSSIIIPRNVVFLTCLIFLLLIVIVILCLCFFLEDLNKINLVFVVLIDNLLTFYQSVILSISN